MANIKFFSGEEIPLELHKVRIVQKLNLVPIERRRDAIKGCGPQHLQNSLQRMSSWICSPTAVPMR